MPIVLKSGSLNLLEPSEPVKACNGIALPYLNLGSPRRKIQCLILTKSEEILCGYQRINLKQMFGDLLLAPPSAN
jgi:hypothetical protein